MLLSQVLKESNKAADLRRARCNVNTWPLFGDCTAINGEGVKLSVEFSEPFNLLEYLYHKTIPETSNGTLNPSWGQKALAGPISRHPQLPQPQSPSPPGHIPRSQPRGQRLSPAWRRLFQPS